MANGVGDGKVGTTFIIGGTGSGGLPGTFGGATNAPTPGIGSISSADPRTLEVKGSGS